MRWRTWQLAMTEALYGPGGFYRTPGAPAAHFRTSAHLGEAFADALLALATRVDAELAHPDPFDLVDLGAGGGELVTALQTRAPTVAPGLADRLRLTGVDVADRPPALPTGIGWAAEIPGITGLLVANEWLDNVPLDIAEFSAGGPRLLQVDEAGNERPGPPLPARDNEWLARWLPGAAGNAEIGRAEIGATRDAAWARAVERVTRGAAVAIDYGATAAATLTGFRAGREVAAVPDGTCDLTASVFFPSVAAAGARAAGQPATTLTQRDALRALGVEARRPPPGLATDDPKAYVAALAALSRRAALVDPAGLGAFTWLVQPVRIGAPL
jgi:SAM-dependent MidA family methyltransferase